MNWFDESSSKFWWLNNQYQRGGWLTAQLCSRSPQTCTSAVVTHSIFVLAWWEDEATHHPSLFMSKFGRISLHLLRNACRWKWEPPANRVDEEKSVVNVLLEAKQSAVVLLSQMPKSIGSETVHEQNLKSMKYGKGHRFGPEPDHPPGPEAGGTLVPVRACMSACSTPADELSLGASLVVFKRNEFQKILLFYYKMIQISL